MSSSPCYLDPIVIPLIHKESQTVLDVGCGFGRWGTLIQSNFWEAGLSNPPVVDGFDAFQPNVDFCLKRNCYRHVWQQVMPSPLNGSWDTVLAIEIIEHIEKEKAEETIRILEDVTKKRIIITMPNWPYFRDGMETILGYNEFEAHKSYFPQVYFRKHGYKAILVGDFGKSGNLLNKAIQKLMFPKNLVLVSMPRRFLGSAVVFYKDVK